jgi:nitroimidazol reductase NimA-like FMN-containing flavoprotein (pyridoxamine 5'-phosphate oxidase superfamily)
MSSPGSVPDRRVRLRRQPHRARYNLAAIHDVLDSQLVAHVAFVEAGQPYCVPTLHARVADELFIHGSTASRAMRALGTGISACVTVTAIDGLVLARSAFEHSANYRSAMLLGKFRAVDGVGAKLAAFEAFTNKLVPGRWNEVRPPNRKELAASTILSTTIAISSVKIRTGPPDDGDTPDADIDAWAGVLPIVTSFDEAQAAPGLRDGIGLAESVRTLLAHQHRQRDGSELAADSYKGC